jgi:hypothetical protein
LRNRIALASLGWQCSSRDAAARSSGGRVPGHNLPALLVADDLAALGHQIRAPFARSRTTAASTPILSTSVMRLLCSGSFFRLGKPLPCGRGAITAPRGTRRAGAPPAVDRIFTIGRSSVRATCSILLENDNRYH